MDNILQSDNTGGLNTTDSTNRHVYQSHQKASRLAADGITPAHYGEVIRMQLMHEQAKAVIAFQENYINPGTPRTVAWLVAHGASNDDPNLWHNHFSIEIPDENGNMQTALEFPFAPYDVENGYGMPMADHYVRSVRKFIAANKGITIEGTAGTDRSLTFSTGAFGSDAARRWSVIIDQTAEGGSNAGSDFRINRRSDAGAYVATPFFIKRSNGNVGINTTTPANTLSVVGTTATTHLVITNPTVPTSATAAGVKGTIAYDADYMYVCVATDQWRRVALASW